MNICLFLCLFVGGVGLLVCMFWFSWCVWLFNCWFVFSNIQIQIQICTFALLSFSPKVNDCMRRAPQICTFRFRYQIQISDSDSDLRSQIQICTFKQHIQQSQNNQTNKAAQALRGAPLVRFAHSNSDLRFRSQIHVQISDLRFILARL